MKDCMTSKVSPPTIGVFVPTFNRPDFIRFCLLQLIAQTLKPNFVVVHQNGPGENYHKVIEDIDFPFDVEWIFDPRQLSQHDWYSVPLKRLTELDCEYYFWMDHDDIYKSDHIRISVEELKDNDFRISKYSDLIVIGDKKNKFVDRMEFSPHAPGGQSSSMAFNRKFAICLLEDIEKNQDEYFTDNIVAKITMPKFKCLSSDHSTTSYVCHKNTHTSGYWVDFHLND